ncbi:hypothetical protein GCM10025867_15190 [Frondihabitans sucicola]|uniref:DUF1905 domain-containing protein n=1 Tax=Frondihabitans sucicola TaxID=1268041 RepID=A0ABN6XYS4_9MICO|nr:YdeI/OmpD-associated family protein [Frondihabitans sucicola]BDZ49278.1 hypothetical protein GCM10025867_15190 [Frondihabitans sucicola]
MPTFHTAILQARATATGLEVPPEIIDELGAGKKPAVVVTVGDYTYRSTVGVMGGRFLVPLSSDHRKASGLAAGDEVDVTLSLDDAPRDIAPPADLADLLGQDPALLAAFHALSYSRKRALVEPIEQAKAADTRQRRLDKAIETLRA